MTTSTDRMLVLDTVDRFVTRAIAPIVERPERPMSADQLATVLAGAGDLGLVDAHADELAVLERLGRANVSVALCVHTRSLARALAANVGLPSGAADALALGGTHGLGRVAWARAIAGATLAEDERASLGDAYAPSAARILPIEPVATGLVSLHWTEGAGFGIARHDRDDLAIERLPHAHGLDELALSVVQRIGPGASTGVDRALAARAAAAWRLGLVAIAAGAVAHAHALAAAFAATRRQGGVVIDQHAAVLGLLGRVATARAIARAMLDAEAREPRAVLAATAQCLPLLSDAANGALQVFGGLGYMRETGLEKIVRDLNCLRILGGSPRELEIVAAELERLDA